MAQIAQGVRPNTTGSSNPPMTSSSTIGQVDAPSRTMRTYTNRKGAYALSYPSNWRVYDSGGFGVTIAPEGGVGVANGREEVVYGAIVNHYDPFGNSARTYLRDSRGGQITMQEATEDLLRQIQQSSPHLRVINGSGQSLNVDGKTAMAASLRGRNPNTRLDERVTVVTRPLADGHLMYVVFVTPEQEVSRYNSVLNAMVKSINVDDAHRH
jgi:hypothetical protein